MSDWITVRVTQTKGSAPREAGTFMRVSTHEVRGTIGGGALEWDAIQHARRMLEDGSEDMQRICALGPDMGQCCGGVVVLDFSTVQTEAQMPMPPLWIWGAGHVGRAIAQVVAPLEDREIFLIDVAEEKLPDPVPEHVEPLLAADPTRLVNRAPAQSDHVIVTYSHDLDLKLCDALLRHGFGSAGLIGSATKWARFRKRLSALGHSEPQISRITCPIGDPSLGKHPQAIAVGVASDLILSAGRQTLGEGIAL